MSFGFEHQPRWVLDSSSVSSWWCDLYLQEIVSCMPHMLELHPDYCDGKQYVDKFDRPFIFLPPCWSELRVGLEALTRLEDPWVNKIEKTYLLLKGLVKANVMTDDWGDSMDTSEGRREERKLWWLKFVSDHLKTIGKKVVFISENPMLLLRASIAGITSYSAKEFLVGSYFPREGDPVVNSTEDYQSVEIWTKNHQTNRNVLIVDKKYFASDEGARLNDELYFSVESESFWLFLTKEVQEFAQEYQYDQINQPHYPFSVCAPEHADINSCPDHDMSTDCHLAKNGCKVVEHVVESEALLARPIDFVKDYLWWIIGEPFGVETGDGICLDQALEASRVFIISDDKEWAKNIRSKILRCRPQSSPEILDMKAAFEKFGRKWRVMNAAKDEDVGRKALGAPSASDTSISSIDTGSSGQSSMLEDDTSQMHVKNHDGIPLRSAACSNSVDGFL